MGTPNVTSPEERKVIMPLLRMETDRGPRARCQENTGTDTLSARQFVSGVAEFS